MPDTLTIRSMTETDLVEVCEIEQSIFSQPWSREGFLGSLNSEHSIYLVAVEENHICGYCGLLQALDEADITNVAVRESSRGRGVAFAMLTELMEQGKEKGITAFTLEVRKSNEAALHLYERLGFQNVGIRKNFYDFPREDAVIMWKY